MKASAMQHAHTTPATPGPWRGILGRLAVLPAARGAPGAASERGLWDGAGGDPGRRRRTRRAGRGGRRGDGAPPRPSRPWGVGPPRGGARAPATADGPGVIRSPQRLLGDARWGVRRAPRAPLA